MIHATLQIQTDFHYSLRGKILVIVKDSSGKPIFLCSLAPKKKNAPSYTTPPFGGGCARGALDNRVTAILSASDTKKQKNPVHSAQLLGFKLGQACISKGIQSVDVVIQEHNGPTSLLLQGLRMGGVRFNRFRIFNAANRSENLKGPILDRRTEQLAKHNQAVARLLARRANERIYSAAAAARRSNWAVPRSAKGDARAELLTAERGGRSPHRAQPPLTGGVAQRGGRSPQRAQPLQTQYIANVQNTLNNTIITITNRFGNTKLWCSSGSIGLKASRRSTNYAAQSVAEAVAKKCRRLGIRRVEVKVQGVGYGKPSALKGLRIGGLKIKRIIDTTPKAHNGCRAPKKRRV